MAGRFAIETVFKGVDKMTAPVGKMQGHVRRFTRSMERGFRRANKAVTKLAKKMRNWGAAIGAVLIPAIAGVGLAITEVADRADALSKQAKILDLPIKDLQEWQFAAEQSGISSESFTKSLGILDKQIGQARTGSGTLVTQLKKNDIVFLKQILNVKDTSKALELVLKKLRSIKNPADRAAFSFAAFGKAGFPIIRMAQSSAKELKNLRKEAEKNGLITQKQATAAEAFNDQLNSLKHTIQGVVQEALLPLMPVLKKFLKDMQTWIFANRKLIKTKIQDFVRKLGLVLKFIGKHAKKIFEVTKVVVELIVTLRIFIGVMTLVNLVLTLNPIGVIVVGIGLLIAAIVLLIVKWKTVKKFFVAVAQDMANVFKGIGTKLKGIITAIGSKFKWLKNLILDVKGVARGAGSLFEHVVHPFGHAASQGAHQVNSVQAQVVSPQHRVATAINEKRTIDKSEVTIRDQTNRSVVTHGALGKGVTLKRSGVF